MSIVRAVGLGAVVALLTLGLASPAAAETSSIQPSQDNPKHRSEIDAPDPCGAWSWTSFLPWQDSCDERKAWEEYDQLWNGLHSPATRGGAVALVLAQAPSGVGERSGDPVWLQRSIGRAATRGSLYCQRYITNGVFDLLDAAYERDQLHSFVKAVKDAADLYEGAAAVQDAVTDELGESAEYVTTKALTTVAEEDGLYLTRADMLWAVFDKALTMGDEMVTQDSAYWFMLGVWSEQCA